MLKINEIFASIEGEGSRAGFPATFIRLDGCNLHCSYCDTRYSCTGDHHGDMTVQEVVDRVIELKLKKVTITGGEPLIHPDVDKLITALVKENFQINIETNGSIDIARYTYKGVQVITMDYKCPSSGVESYMLTKNLGQLRLNDVLKFVVGTQEDLERMKEVLREYPTTAQVFVSPVFGSIEAVDIVNYILKNNLQDCRVQLQLHKYIWNPAKRGV